MFSAYKYLMKFCRFYKRITGWSVYDQNCIITFARLLLCHFKCFGILTNFGRLFNTLYKFNKIICCVGHRTWVQHSHRFMVSWQFLANRLRWTYLELHNLKDHLGAYKSSWPVLAWRSVMFSSFNKVNFALHFNLVIVLKP